MRCSFFKPPEFLSLPFFGLSMSQNSIKLTKFVTKKEGYIPTILEEINFTQTCDFLNNLNAYSECEELTNILKNLKKKHNIQFVQLAIPEENTYVFRIAIPPNTIELVEDFIVNNIEQHIPLSIAEIYFDYKILKPIEGGNSTPVVVTAISKIFVEKYTNILESCGIYVLGCEPETHAIARCVIDNGDMNPYVLINITLDSTNISIVEEGLVQYSQTISIKTEDIISNISPETSALFKDSINKVIIYWFTSKEQNTKNSKIENIILTGENIESSDIINFLESNLFVNVTFANVWKNCFDIHTYIPKISKKESLKFAASIGLSLFKIK